MQDRAKLNNGKSSKIMCPSDYASLTWEQFRALLVAGTAYIDITANNDLDNNAGVSVVGTALNKANILSDATASKVGYDAQSNPTINDMFGKLADIATVVEEITFSSTGWVQNVSGFYEQTAVLSTVSITATDRPLIESVVPNTVTGSNINAYENNVSYVTKFESGNNSIKAICYSMQPTMDIKFAVRGK